MPRQAGGRLDGRAETHLRGQRMGVPRGTTTGRGRWTRGGIAAAALVVVGLLVGAGYAAGYVARNGQDPVRQGPSAA
jgi:hypothetical protein